MLELISFLFMALIIYYYYKLRIYYSKRGYILHDRDYQAIFWFDQLDDELDGLDDELDVQ
jgi:hypothetical protein